MTIPLTPESARIGMLVKCVDPGGWSAISTGEVFVIRSVNGDWIELDGINGQWFYERFVLADPPAPTLTPELLAALREWYEYWNECERDDLTLRLQRLMNAIERAGILAPDPAKEPAPLPAMYLGEEAFQ